MILTITVLSALVTQATLTPLTNRTDVCINLKELPNLFGPKEQLYDNVVLGHYQDALLKTLTLKDNGKGDEIKFVVDKLLSDSKRNVVEFAYYLWNTFGMDIVKDYFPKEFRTIFSEDPVLIINKGYELDFKMIDENQKLGIIKSESTNKTSQLMSWRLYPIWERNRLYFRIFNKFCDHYLRLSFGLSAERVVFGSNDDISCNVWYLHPVVIEKDTFFYIYDRKYNRPLTLDSEIDGSSRDVIPHKGSVTRNPEKFRWHIVPFQ